MCKKGWHTHTKVDCCYSLGVSFELGSLCGCYKFTRLHRESCLKWRLGRIARVNFDGLYICKACDKTTQWDPINLNCFEKQTTFTSESSIVRSELSNEITSRKIERSCNKYQKYDSNK